MLDFLRAKHSRMLVWTLLVLIVVGLAGFGVSNSVGLGSNAVATVGETEISTTDYSRAMDQEMRALTQRLGRSLPMSEARQYGIDNVVLGRLVGDAALDEEARRVGISVGDDVVAGQVMGEQAFKGPDGKFNRDVYAQALRGIGMKPAQFEAQLRREASREMVASAVQAGVPSPTEEAGVMLRYLGEKRGFDWLRVTPAMLAEPVPAPTDAEIEAEYKAHPDAYTSPEIREVSYASVTPEALAATIEVPEADLRAAYDAAGDKYSQPERRVVDRIGFATEADAAAAKARLDAGEITFDALGTERGLAAKDMDQGAVTADRLGAEARAAVFGAAGPGIIGPVPTPLGPSLYRINAVLAAHTTDFEAAREELRAERALKLATDKIAEETAAVEDLVAGGATLEEIAAETNLTLGTVELAGGSGPGIGADPAFQKAAAGAETKVETDLFTIAGGGIATLRIEEVKAPALRPLEEVRAEAAAAWTAGETTRRLAELAKGFGTELDGGLSFADLAARIGVTPASVAPIARGESPEGLPPGVATAVFDEAPGAANGATVVVPDTEGPILAKLGEVVAFDPAAPANTAILANAETTLRGQMADDMLALYTGAVRDAAGVEINRRQMDAALARFP